MKSKTNGGKKRRRECVRENRAGEKTLGEREEKEPQREIELEIERAGSTVIGNEREFVRE